jgi:hypothetical protein
VHGVGAAATGDGLDGAGTGEAAANGEATAGGVAIAVANETDGAAPGLPATGDDGINGCAVTVGVGARGASTSVVLV